MRGDQLARQWRIIRAIEAGSQGLTVAEIADLEDCGPRTIYRDLEALQEAGFPLYTEKVNGTTRWAFIDTYKFKIPPPFTLSELMSLYVYRDLVRVFRGTYLFDSLESLFKKVRASLPPQTIAYLDGLQSVYQVGIKPYNPYGPIREILHQVSQAAEKHLRIEMVYTPLHNNETRRKVDPYRVWFYDGTLYMIGFCHLRGEIRMFVLDRIKMLQVTQERFSPPKDFDLNEFLKHRFKVMDGDLHTVKVRISPGWARWVGEKVWHESQKARKLPDGGLELTFRVAGLEEVKRWVLSLGPEAEVLEPPGLIEMIREDLTRTLEQYYKTAPAVGRGIQGITGRNKS
jgi:predicted DNA-binding transcriptional regulator YafY